MSLTLEEVEKIAALARLELTDDEKESFRERISSVLDYVGKLAEAEIGDADPMSHVAPVLNVLREDESEARDERSRKAAVDAFPEKEGDMLKVRAVFS